MRITSKKALAIALSLAMLVTCMAFSFSANAAAIKMWWNDFEGAGTATSQYGGAEANSAWNSGRLSAGYGNYAAPEQGTDGNDYMALGFGTSNSWKGVSGFKVTHENVTVKGATGAGTSAGYTTNGGANYAYGYFRPQTGKYAVKLDYRVESFNQDAVAGVDICLAYGSFNWNADYQVMSGGADIGLNTSYKFPVVATVATVTKDEVGADWRTAVAYIDIDNATGAELHIFAKRHNSASDSLTGTEVWVDNVEIYQYEQLSDFPTVTFYYNGNKVGETTGFAGATFAMPTLTDLPTNATISYWDDAEFSTPATIPTVYPETSQTIYVKADKYMVNNPWSFERETAGASIASSTQTATYGEYLISDKYAHSGNQSAELECKGIATTYSYKTQFMLKDGNDKLISLEIGKDYLLSYWVLVPTDAPCDFKNNMWLYADPSKTGSYSAMNTNLASGSAKVIFRDKGAGSYVTVPKDGQWHQVIRKIDGSKITAGGCGYTLVGLSHTEAVEGLKVYIDDLDVICLDDLAAASTGRTAYLYKGVTAQGATNLHKYVGTPAKAGAYTSLRLAAKYTAGNSDGDSIMLGGVALPLSARGIVVGTEDMTLKADGTKGTDYLWRSYKDSALNEYWQPNPVVTTDEPIELTYTLRLANMGAAWFDSATEYVYRGCFEVTLPSFYKENAVDTLVSDEQAIIYGGVSEAKTFGEMADTFTKDYWFNNLP